MLDGMAIVCTKCLAILDYCGEPNMLYKHREPGCDSSSWTSMTFDGLMIRMLWELFSDEKKRRMLT